MIVGKTTARVGFKPKTLLYFIMKFRIRNDLHVVICTRKPCISTCLTEETLTFTN